MGILASIIFLISFEVVVLLTRNRVGVVPRMFHRDIAEHLMDRQPIRNMVETRNFFGDLVPAFQVRDSKEVEELD